MTTTLKYNLTQITDLSFSGFNYEIPEDTVSMINYLCSQVGSEGLAASVFTKTEESRNKASDGAFSSNVSGIGGFKPNSKKYAKTTSSLFPQPKVDRSGHAPPPPSVGSNPIRPPTN